MADTVIQANIRVKRDSLADFQEKNQIFAAGEPLHVIDDTHNDWLSGDGVRDFNTLWNDANSIAGRAKTAATAAAASASAASASAVAAARFPGQPGPKGEPGQQGLPGTNGVPTDAATASNLQTDGTQTKAALVAMTGSGATDPGNGYAYAVVDQNGSVSEIAADLSGQIPAWVLTRWARRMMPLLEALTKSRLDQLAAYGDSLTEAGQGGGATWETTLQTLRGRGTIANRGVSGQTSGTVAIRQGGAVAALTSAITIPADASAVAVSFQSTTAPLNNRGDASNTIVGTLGGVAGTLKITSNTGAATGAFSGTFTPTTAVGSTTAVPAGTAFIPPTAAVDREATQIFWTGRNDVAFSGATTTTGVVAATTAMAAYLAASVQVPRFLVVSVTTSQTETTGTSGYTSVKAINTALAAAFPNNFVDLLTEIKTNGLAKCGITPTAADNTALAGDTIPPSLTVDGLHFTEACRTNVIAPFIARQMALRGWS